jgi:cobalt-zinc-cadmium efflux system protein
MAHDHSHHDHHHTITLKDVNQALIIGIALNLLFVVVEAIFGFYINSLSLLSDAGHNLADVGSLALSLLAFRLMKVKSNKVYTYGYRKTSILAALLNSMILLLSLGAIIYQAIYRFFHPAPIPGGTIAWVAGIGIVINYITARLFVKGKEKDLNIKSAYLHMMADALVSGGLVVGGIVIFYTDWYWLDPVLSIVIAIVILTGTWSLLTESLRLSMDAVPKGIDLEEIKKATSNITGVKNVHHVHVWAMSTTENAMTVHAVVDSDLQNEDVAHIKNAIRHEMTHFNIQHTTVETEFEEHPCKKPDC